MERSQGKAERSGAHYRLLGQARRGNAFEETVGLLLRGMKVGIFPPAGRLPPERELAEGLGVSRATLRDALAELQNAGYITVQRGRYGGAVVASELPATGAALAAGDEALVEDILTFRAVVEPAAAALAAEAVLTAAQRTGLREALDAVSSAGPGQYRPLDARLHIVIAELTPSPRLAESVAEARAAASDLLDRIPVLAPNIEHSETQHRDIVEAILDGDPTRAREVMAEHLEGTASLLRGFLSSAATARDA